MEKKKYSSEMTESEIKFGKLLKKIEAQRKREKKGKRVEKENIHKKG